jgi:DNA modification methylase
MTAEIEQMPSARLIVGDVIEQLDGLPAESNNLVVSSPPYNLQKSYEREDRRTLAEYGDWQRQVIAALDRTLAPNSSVCWQVGTYVTNGEIFPLDEIFLPLFRERGFKLRNRIVWRYNFGLNASQRFSGRYETVLWLTKGDDYTFNLDPVRIPQLYPGKRHGKSKGDKAGKPSGNPLGKNPSDFWEFVPSDAMVNDPVWNIPNVKAKHPEHTSHPCQFPVELAERCVLSLTNPGDVVLDPFVGTGATAIAAIRWGRSAVGIDRDPEYIGISRARLKELADGTLATRSLGKPVRTPQPSEGVARVPAEWLAKHPDGEGGNDGQTCEAESQNQKAIS